MEAISGLLHALQAPLFFGFFTLFFVSYLLFALGSYLYLYRIKNHPLTHKKIQIEAPSHREVLRELFWSVVVLGVWSVMAMFFVALYQQGYTQLYVDIDAYGWVYLIASILILFFTHDAYFYWTHRLMHSRVTFFYNIHRIHHTSLNPTPFAIYTFGPTEAILLGLYFYAIAFLLPIHLYAFIAFFILNTFFNTAGHLGYEFLPESIHDTAVGKVFNTSTHHNMHHQYGRSNYALYLTLWDTLMKTNDSEYQKAWKEVHSRLR